MRIFTRLLLALAFILPGPAALAQESVSLHVRSTAVDGRIDPLIYGQLFEHIYFSANNGVWQEIIYGRSFEPEHYPGIPPRDGYFDGWFADADDVLHSPTRYEQPIELVRLDTDSYDIEMDVKWRAYRLPGRRWSGGLLDLRFAVKDQANGDPYFLRLYDPAFEGQRFALAQTQAQIEADNQAKALAQAQKQATSAEFTLATRVEKEVEMYPGRTRRVVTLDPFATKAAQPSQIDQDAWHHVKISCRARSISVWWDGKKILSKNVPGGRKENTVTLWENYTEALFRNIRISSGKQVLFEGQPEQVKIPEVAPEWTSFGDAAFKLVKGDAVNMDYAQQIAAKGISGLQQGPQAVRPGDPFVGSVYAKGDGRARLSVGLRRNGEWLVRKSLGCPSPDWQKYEFVLDGGAYEGDADFAIAAEDGTLLVDMATMSTQKGLALGGFRPDIFQAVKDLHGLRNGRFAEILPDEGTDLVEFGLPDLPVGLDDGRRKHQQADHEAVALLVWRIARTRTVSGSGGVPTGTGNAFGNIDLDINEAARQEAEQGSDRPEGHPAEKTGDPLGFSHPLT